MKELRALLGHFRVQMLLWGCGNMAWAVYCALMEYLIWATLLSAFSAGACFGIFWWHKLVEDWRRVSAITREGLDMALEELRRRG